MARQWHKVVPEEAKSHPLYGVKGWLALFILAFALLPLRGLATIASEAHYAGTSLGEFIDHCASLGNYLIPLVVADGLIGAAIVWMALSKTPRFRWGASVILILQFPLNLLVAIASTAPMVAAGIGASIPQWVVSCVIWITYLHRSERVRVTFEHCVLAKDPVLSQAPEAEQLVVATPLNASSTPVANASAKLPMPEPEAACAAQPSAAGAVIASSDDDEALWARAFQEFNSPQRKAGLWAMAFAKSSGNESAAQAMYLSERVQQMIAERAASNRASAERLAQQRQVEEASSRVAAMKAAQARADFVAGKRLSHQEVIALAASAETDPGLLALADRFRGETLLHWCARHGLKAEVLALLGKGANPNAPNGAGRRPHDIAEDLELKGILRLAATSGSN